VSGRDHHHETAGIRAEKLSRGGEGERGLSRTWRRDVEKVAPRSFAEPLERRALPGTQSDRTRHSVVSSHVSGAGHEIVFTGGAVTKPQRERCWSNRMYNTKPQRHL